MLRFAAFTIGLLCLLAGIVPGQVRVAPAGATVEGVVRRAGTDEPLAGTRVTLISLDARSRSGFLTEIGLSASSDPVAATSAAVAHQSEVPGVFTRSVSDDSEMTFDTEDDGRFSFRNVPAGSYELTFAADGHVSQVYGEKLTGSAGKRLVLNAGQSTGDINVRLTPAGNIEGHLDEAGGGPFAGVPVYLWRYEYSYSGNRTMAIYASALTDDRGFYRFFWITPGRYYLGAGGPVKSNAGTQSMIAPVVYPNVSPGVPDAGGAEPIEILPGSNRSVNWTLPARRSLRIRARITDSLPGPPTERPPVTVIAKEAFDDGTSWLSRGRRQGEVGEAQVRYDPATGLLEITDLPGGDYEIRIDKRRGDDGRVLAGSHAVVVTVHLKDSNVEGLTLDLADTAPSRFEPIRGRILTKGPALPAGKAPKILLYSGGSESREFRAGADGEFLIETGRDPDESDIVAIGAVYRASVADLPKGWAVESATLNGTDVWTAASTFSPGAELVVTLSPSAGRIDGRAHDAAGAPVPAQKVVLIPRVPDRPERYAVIADPKGHFEFENVQPGDYVLIAWEAIEPYAYFDPAVVKRFEGQGATAHVGRSESLSVDVPLIPAGTRLAEAGHQ